MQTSNLAKGILNYLPLLAVIVIAVMGVFITKDLYQTSLDSQVKAATQIQVEQNNPQLLAISGAMNPCISPYIYTSLPVKCRTSDGKFIQANAISSNVLLSPELK